MLTGIMTAVFLVLFALTLLVIGLGLRVLEAERQKKVSSVLKAVSRVEELPKESKILIDDDKSGNSFSLAGLPVFSGLEAKIEQAGLGWSVGGFLFATLVAAVLGGLLGSLIPVPIIREFAIVGLALFFGALPYLWLSMARRRRMAAFEEEFPESLDFLARSLKAGHAFTVALEMMADESPEPVGTEFRKLFHEQNLGSPLDVAMRNLTIRVPLLDVRFFVSAVLMQRETGGNLAEILENLAHVIRERFRLKGHVRAASAHGRITATVLTFMPIITTIFLLIVAPTYLELLVKDSHGKYLIVGAILAMLVGYYWMRRIIDIKI